MHHAAPRLPGGALVHPVLEETLARRDAVGEVQDPVVDGEGGHQEQGQHLEENPNMGRSQFPVLEKKNSEIAHLGGVDVD